MTPIVRVLLPLFAVGLLGLAGTVGVTPPDALEPATGARVAPTTAPPETLRTTADPETPLILSLPAEVGGQRVERYTLLRGPALSGVAGRSFTWIPHGTAPGTHEALLQTQSPNAPADTLVLRIDLRS
ncbi:MAG: hypothetical protein ABEK75_06835 [Salinibacter sp.]